MTTVSNKTKTGLPSTSTTPSPATNTPRTNALPLPAGVALADVPDENLPPDARRKLFGTVGNAGAREPRASGLTLKAGDLASRAAPKTTSGDTGWEPLSNATAESAVGTVNGFLPKEVPTLDTLQVLDSVKNGKVNVDIPLKAGSYKLQGHDVTVKDGTVMTVQMDVKDGKLVPSRDKHGKDTGGGCKVEINPPVDLPAWATGKGAYLKDRGDGNGQLKANIGGWFDQNVGKKGNLDVKDVVRSFSDGSAAGQKPTANGKALKTPPKNSPLPADMVQWDEMKFNVGNLELKDKVIQAGGASIDVGPGSQLQVSGTGKSATLHGQVNLDGVSIKQGGADIKTGPGTATLHASYSHDDDGNITLKTRLSNVNARLDSFESTQARTDGQAPDRVALGPANLRNSSFDVDVKVGKGHDGMAALLGTRTALHVEGDGNLGGATLHVKDAKDSAEFSLGPASFKGTLDVDRNGLRLDGQLKGASLGIRDLQDHNGASGLDLHHANVEGDARVKVNTGRGTFDLDAQGKKIDLRLDDYRGRSPGIAVDLGRTELTGQGNLHVSSETGVELGGNMQLKTTVDAMKVDTKSTSLDVKSGSQLDLTVTKMNVGGPQPFELQGRGDVNLGLENYRTDLPGVNATGSARLKGRGDLSITGGDVALTKADATLSVDVDKAQLAPNGKNFQLDLAKGSNVTLHLSEARYTAGAAAPYLKLGSGSSVHGVLESGHIDANGKRIELQRGSDARFDIDKLDVNKQGVQELKGKLSVDTALDVRSTDGKALVNVPGVRAEDLQGARGRARISVDNVTFGKDGTLSMDGVNASVRAHIGKVTGARNADGQTVGTLPAQANAPIERPVGTLTQKQVEASSAAQIAGASNIARNESVDGLGMAKRLQNGTLTMEIPVEGRVGDSWYKSADFEKGTKLTVQAKVVDGKIVPGETKASFNKKGDGPAWVTVKGAYFDKENTLRLDLGGMKDFAVPNMEKMPLDVSKFVDRLAPQKPSSGGGASGGGGPSTSAFKVDQAHVDIRDASFKPGPLTVPGGAIDITGQTRLSVSGTAQQATITGRVDVKGVDLVQDGVALKTGAGTAELRIDYSADGDNKRINTSLSKMSLDTQYAVEKRANGDYLHLAQGQMRNATFNMGVTLDGKGKMTPGDVRLTVPSFTGELRGGRVTIPDGDGTAQVEIGHARLNGEVYVDGRQIAVRGKMEELDASIDGLAVRNGATKMNVEHARIVGSGDVAFSTEDGLSVDANVTQMDVRAKGIEASNGTVDLRVGRTLVQGSGRFQLRSTGDLAMNGKLRVDTVLQGGAITQGGNRATIAPNSRIVADVSQFEFAKSGRFQIRGEGAVDLGLLGVNVDVNGVAATGDARFGGMGAFEIDSAQGVSLPRGVDVDVTVRNGGGTVRR